MHRQHFQKLVNLVRPALERNETMAALRNGAIEPEFRLAITLRITSGASDLDLIVLWNVSRTSIYYIYHETVHVLLNALTFDGFPGTEEKCRTMAHQFDMSRRTIYPLTRCIGALDGIGICIANLKISECINPATYCHKKGYYRYLFKQYVMQTIDSCFYLRNVRA